MEEIGQNGGDWTVVSGGFSKKAKHKQASYFRFTVLNQHFIVFQEVKTILFYKFKITNIIDFVQNGNSDQAINETTIIKDALNSKPKIIHGFEHSDLMSKIKDYLNKAKTFDDLAKEILDNLKVLTDQHFIVDVSYEGDKGYLITKENCIHSENKLHKSKLRQKNNNSS